MSKLIFGCGYLGHPVAQRCLAAGEKVFVVTRSADRARQFAESGYVPFVADVTRPASLANLPQADGVLYAVGYDRTAATALEQVYVDGLRNVLDALWPQTARFVYVSSTGVYGQAGGQWIDENSPCRPVRDAGRACLAAEHLLLAHPLGRAAVILRLSGIYGPGRIPRKSDLLSSRPLDVPASGYLNLIHVDDAASVIVAAQSRAVPPRIYNVTDGHPIERRAYFQELARVLKAPPPRFAAPGGESPSADRARSDKRVSNARLLAELEITLAYPSHREGLAAIVEAESQ